MAVPFQVDPRSATPIYDQIVAQVRMGIASGTLPRGDALPSVRQLAIALRVNPNTVARAYRELEALGLVESQQGRGTFVASVERPMGAAQRRQALEPAIERLTSEATLLGVDAEELLRLVRESAARREKGARR